MSDIAYRKSNTVECLSSDFHAMHMKAKEKKPEATTKSATARQTFAENMQRRRKRLGVTQEGLAHDAGVNRTYVSALESGKHNISIDTMERVAKVLDVELWKLLKPRRGTSRKTD